MKKIIIAILTLVTVATAMHLLSPDSAWADCNGVATSIINCGENESGIGAVLKIILNVLTVGIGIAGTIGVTIAGIQYLTAGGNEEQTRKAKRRIYEIVIGVLAFVLTNTGLQWLLPGGSLDPDDIPAYSAADNTQTQNSNTASTTGTTGGNANNAGGTANANTNQYGKKVSPPTSDDTSENIKYAVQFLDQFIVDANHFYGKNYTAPSTMNYDSNSSTASFGTPDDMEKPTFNTNLIYDLYPNQRKVEWYHFDRVGKLTKI